MSSSLRLATAAVLVALAARAQVLTVAGPAVPGAPLTGTVVNNLTLPLLVPGSVPLFLLSASGDLVAPVDVGGTDVVFQLPPGGTTTVSVPVPATGPGSAGSVVAYVPYGNGAAARVDVGIASPSFPAIHAFNENVLASQYGHSYVPGAATTSWRLANTSTSTVVFGPGDALNVYTPGGLVPIATAALQGLSIAPGVVASMPLPLLGLPPQPYSVEVVWSDPLIGPTSSRHGITPSQPVDLHLAAGHVLPPGGVLPMRVRAFQGIAAIQAPLYLVLAGVLPGSIALPASNVLPSPSVLPLVADEISVASATNALFGYLPANIGFLNQIQVPCGLCGPLYAWETQAPTLVHPNLPGASGITLRLAVLVFDPPSNTWSASQSEDVLLL